MESLWRVCSRYASWLVNSPSLSFELTRFSYLVPIRGAWGMGVKGSLCLLTLGEA